MCFLRVERRAPWRVVCLLWVCLHWGRNTAEERTSRACQGQDVAILRRTLAIGAGTRCTTPFALFGRLGGSSGVRRRRAAAPPPAAGEQLVVRRGRPAPVPEGPPKTRNSAAGASLRASPPHGLAAPSEAGDAPVGGGRRAGTLLAFTKASRRRPCWEHAASHFPPRLSPAQATARRAQEPCDVRGPRRCL